MMKENNCSPEFLKAVSGKFELETVFILNLAEKNIFKMNAILKCKNLVSLNLSKNKLTSISGIENLPELIFLDLSFNQLISIDGLEFLTKVKHLKLQGNKIDKPKNVINLFISLLNYNSVFEV
jgi:internalin A